MMEFRLFTVEADVIATVADMNPTTKRVTKETCLWHDLHIHGEDAAELLEDIARRYNLTFEGMWFPDYFPTDHETGPLWRLAEWLGSSQTKRRRFTVGHLLAVIEHGHWFDPDNSNHPPP